MSTPTAQQNLGVGAATVASSLSNEELGRAPDIPAEFVRGTNVPGASITLCSIYPQDLESITLPHGGGLKVYKIKAGSMAKPSYTTIYNTFTMVMGMQTDPDRPPDREPKQITASDIVKDLLKHWGGDHPATRAGFIGVFACKGTTATAEELQRAKEKQEAYFRRIVADADAAWADPRRRNNLSLEEARRAMEWLGDKNHRAHEWYRPISQVEYRACPACASDVETVAHVCKSCHTNIAVWLRDRDRIVEPGSWPGVEAEMKFLAKAAVAAKATQVGVGGPSTAGPVKH